MYHKVLVPLSLSEEGKSCSANARCHGGRRRGDPAARRGAIFNTFLRAQHPRKSPELVFMLSRSSAGLQMLEHEA
jgi:hypothetical protein